MKLSSFTVRDWVYVAVFGALWGALCTVVILFGEEILKTWL